MRVFRADPIVQPSSEKLLLQRQDKSRDFLVERHVLHAQPGARGGRCPAVRHALDFDEGGQRALHEVGVAARFVVDVEALDEGEAEDGAVGEAFLTENVHAADEALPEVAVEGSVDFAEGVFVRGVDGDVELGYWAEGRELVGVLRVAH
jgi:hypothetical protein